MIEIKAWPERRNETASTLLSEMSNKGQQFISGWPMMNNHEYWWNYAPASPDGMSESKDGSSGLAGSQSGTNKLDQSRLDLHGGPDHASGGVQSRRHAFY